MSKISRLGAALGALVVLAGIAVLLYYYRPSIEYAYVDIIEKREHPVAGTWLIGGCLAVVVVVGGLLVWLGRRSRKRDATK
jgi:hypothetical protein